jgi:hypothetical protein
MATNIPGTDTIIPSFPTGDITTPEGAINTGVSFIPYLGSLNSASSFFGGPSIGGVISGLFGGKHHPFNAPAGTVPQNLIEKGILDPSIMAAINSSANRRGGRQLTMQGENLVHAIDPFIADLKELGLTDILDILQTAQTRVSSPPASGPVEARERMQVAADTLSAVVSYLDTLPQYKELIKNRARKADFVKQQAEEERKTEESRLKISIPRQKLGNFPISGETVHTPLARFDSNQDRFDPFDIVPRQREIVAKDLLRDRSVR